MPKRNPCLNKNSPEINAHIEAKQHLVTKIKKKHVTASFWSEFNSDYTSVPSLIKATDAEPKVSCMHNAGLGSSIRGEVR